MSTQEQPASPVPAEPTYSPADGPSREVRFAVVMYGGVSLAIYIHGVARELFHLVQATARKGKGEQPEDEGKPVKSAGELTGAERVYRRLSFLLGDPGLEKSFPDDVAGRKAWFEQLDKSLDEAGPVRFIIDLISGTSAGGINGAFLAKALVYGQPISPLRKLWLDQGDIRTLLNDKKSVEGFPSLPQPGAPESLLNSQRMYLLLFQAIGGVNPKVEASNQSPDAELPVATYVEQLDLFLTTTDIRGAELPIRLADRLVYEQRYRHNFQFIYGTKKTGSGRNDFVPTYDPMLAFAARCTSSFPFAFEPARWTDAEKLLPPPADPEEWKQLWQDWEKNFFTQYTTANDGVDNKCRAFGDGGYLDNKPFSYVTGELQSRRADYPVDRKLIYVEPSPDGSKPKSSGGKCPGKPNVLENVLAALLMLPRQETIREDIERLQERNRLLARVERIRSQLDADTTKRVTTLDTATKFGTDIGAWLQKDVTDLANEFGVAYVSYYRLKVADATDELAELVTRLFGFDPNSDTFEAVRSLARAWRDDLYKAQRPKNSEGWKSHNQFLLDFNYSYRLRKLQFLLARIATLEKTDALSRNEAATLRTLAGLDSVSAPELRKACAEMRGRFSEIYHRLRAGHRELHQEPPAAETNAPSPAPAARLSLGAQAKKLNFKPDELKAILATPDGEDRQDAAQRVYDADEARREACRDFAKTIAGRFDPLFDKAATDSKQALKEEPDDDASLVALKRFLRYYYHHFEDYDQFLYPLLFGTDGEETDQVEILRVSPGDADQLLDQDASTCHKLGGDSFGHFGGFLDKTWRVNDMLWGRLDAVERLLCSLLPVPLDTKADKAKALAALPPELKRRWELRRQLVTQAQAAIVAEEIKLLEAAAYAKARACPQVKDQPALEISRVLVEGFARATDRQKGEDALLGFIRQLTNPEVVADENLRQYLVLHLNEPALLAAYEHARDHDPKPEVQPTLESAARATEIVGRMLDKLAGDKAPVKKVSSALIRAGRAAWLLVEMAVPHGFTGFVLRHWVNVIGLCGAVILAAGLLVKNRDLRYYGLLGLGIAVAIKLVAKAIRSLIHHGWPWLMTWRRAFTLVTWLAVLFAVAALGLMCYFEWPRVGDDLKHLWQSLLNGS